MVRFEERIEVVTAGHYQCPHCHIVMKNFDNRTMACETPNCAGRGVHYDLPATWVRRTAIQTANDDDKERPKHGEA